MGSLWQSLLISLSLRFLFLRQGSSFPGINVGPKPQIKKCAISYSPCKGRKGGYWKHTQSFTVICSFHLPVSLFMFVLQRMCSVFVILMVELRKSINLLHLSRSRSLISVPLYFMLWGNNHYPAVENNNKCILKCAIRVECRRNCYSLRTLHESRRTWVPILMSKCQSHNFLNII